MVYDNIRSIIHPATITATHIAYNIQAKNKKD